MQNRDTATHPEGPRHRVNIGHGAQGASRAGDAEEKWRSQRQQTRNTLRSEAVSALLQETTDSPSFPPSPRMLRTGIVSSISDEAPAGTTVFVGGIGQKRVGTRLNGKSEIKRSVKV